MVSRSLAIVVVGSALLAVPVIAHQQTKSVKGARAQKTEQAVKAQPATRTTNEVKAAPATTATPAEKEATTKTENERGTKANAEATAKKVSMMKGKAMKMRKPAKSSPAPKPVEKKNQ